MPRETQKDVLESERMQILHSQQKALSKQLSTAPKVKKKVAHLPGEENHKRDLAILLKLGDPKISYTQIAAQIGETKSTVRSWFRTDPYVKDRYQYFVDNLTEGALDFLRTYQIEASLTLVSLMRFGSEKYMFESATAILDRAGIPKITKQEIESENTKRHKWDDKDSLADEMRTLSEDKKEEFAQTIEKLEELMLEAAQGESSPDNGSRQISDIPLDGEDINGNI